MAGHTTEGFTWTIETVTPTDATTVRVTIEGDGVNEPSVTVAMQPSGSDRWLSGDWLPLEVRIDSDAADAAEPLYIECDRCNVDLTGSDDLVVRLGEILCGECNQIVNSDTVDPAERAWRERSQA